MSVFFKVKPKRSKANKFRVPIGYEGRFPVLPLQSISEHLPLLLVETHLLEMADHAHKE
ncbi:hypothetical protein K5R88_05215 [Pseudomonas sp. MM213]|uniref:hypothetical protein n=1 Tax=Pseudomonas sp. MM213 TaxID=2866807 RepID=UPI001CF2C65B|nr:hypothetical protein [Pseudomonas sp. MM213]UCP11042.1 hypothetical protein K5R88_05215 [Pseudomonas sp. MM213]